MFETFVCTMAMMSFLALAGPIARMTGMAVWQMGAVVTVSGVAWMLMARPWGRLSDRCGRRPVILVGVAGFPACYVALAAFMELAIGTALPPGIVFAGLLVTRGLAGVFYAAVPATGAALVADHVPAAERPKAMAALGAASALGIVIGPATAGLLASGGLALPLFLIGILPMIGLIVLWRVLPRREHHAPPAPAPLGLFDPRLRHAMLSVFVAMASVAVVQVVVGFYAIDRLALSPQAGARVAGIALACVGIAIIGSQLVMRQAAPVAHRHEPRRISGPLDSEDDLRGVYAQPAKAVRDKSLPHLDKHSRRHVALPPFFCIGSSRPDGLADVSPRGGEAGFVDTLDDRHLAFPGRPGNNRLDTLTNIVRHPAVGQLFFLPGVEDMLRVNGIASVTTDPEVMECV